MIYKRLYSEIGKLLYAVADIDKVITPEEKKALQHVVTTELVPEEKRVDEHGTNLGFYSEIEFEFLDEQIADAESCFESFINFVEDHHTGFDKHMKEICIRITSEVARAYHGTNRKEKLLMEKLRDKLNQIKIKE